MTTPHRTDQEVSQLVESAIDLPRKVANKYCQPGRVEYDDFLSDGMLALTTAAVQWEGSGEFRAFAWEAIVWAAKNRCRKLASQSAVPLLNDEVEGDDLGDVDGRRTRAILDRILSDLPHGMKEDFMVACRVHGVNHRQVPVAVVAKEMGLTRAGIYKRLAALKRYINRHFPECAE